MEKYEQINVVSFAAENMCRNRFVITAGLKQMIFLSMSMASPIILAIESRT
jgi:hypothetical protein